MLRYATLSKTSRYYNYLLLNDIHNYFWLAIFLHYSTHKDNTSSADV